MLDIAIKLFEKGGVVAALFLLCMIAFRELWNRIKELQKEITELQEKRLRETKHVLEIVMNDAQEQRHTLEGVRKAIDALASFVERIGR